MLSSTKSCRRLIFVCFAYLFLINAATAQKRLPIGSDYFAYDIQKGVTVGNYFYFFAINFSDNNNFELWRTDGTQNGTIKLTSGIQLYYNNFSRDKFVVAHNGLVYFEAKNEANGKELWRTDGTVEGTFILEIRPGPASAFYIDEYSYETEFSALPLGNVLLFAANDGIHGMEIWRTDGTNAGTYMVKDIRPGTTNSINNLSADYMPIMPGNITYFNVQNDGGSVDLYRTDGTTAGTYLAISDYKGEQLYNVLGTLYYTYRPTNFANKQLWKTDGTAEGTMLVHDNGDCESNVIAFNNAIYFVVSTPFYMPNKKYMLYKTDGTQAGTEMVKDSIPFYNDWGIGLGVLNNRLYFFLENKSQYPNAILELWHSDGTTEGTGLYAQHICKKINTTSSYSLLNARFKEHDRVIYGWTAPDGHYESWITDGTAAGTQTLKNFGPDAPPDKSAQVWHIGYWKNKFLIRFIDNYNYVIQLWESDGTTAGTTPFTKFDDKYGIDATYNMGMSVFNGSILMGGGGNLYIYSDPALVSPQLSVPLCTSNTYTVTNKAKGTFEANNTFSVQLSNALGNFNSPVTIGSVAATEDGEIPVTIPSNVAAGTHYRVRIVSTNPTFVGADNGVDIQVKVSGAAPVISTTALTNLCPPQNITLTSSACGGMLSWLPSGTGTSLVVSPPVTTTYKAICTSNGCASLQSNGITVNVANSMYTLKSGNWNDPAIWSCGIIPTETRDVLIKSGHKIILSNTMGIQKTKNLTVESGAVFDNNGIYFLSKP